MGDKKWLALMVSGTAVLAGLSAELLADGSGITLAGYIGPLIVMLLIVRLLERWWGLK